MNTLTYLTFFKSESDLPFRSYLKIFKKFRKILRLKKKPILSKLLNGLPDKNLGITLVENTHSAVKLAQNCIGISILNN